MRIRWPRWFWRLSEDFRNYDKQNTDEEKVLAAHYIACYRGVKVLRANRARSGALGMIFLKRGLSPQSALDEVRHEYGHILQMRRLGIFRYFFRVFLPSARSDAAAPDYYEALWEISADVLGGVTSRIHSEEKIAAAQGRFFPPRKR